MNSNRTFTMLKPDSIEQGNMLPILNMIESSGFKIIALKYKRMSRDEAEKFYSIHSDKPFFNDLVSFMTRGPIVAAVLEKDNAVEAFRILLDLLILMTLKKAQLEKNLLNPKEKMLFMVQIVMKMQISKLVFTLTLMKFLANFYIFYVLFSKFIIYKFNYFELFIF